MSARFWILVTTLLFPLACGGGGSSMDAGMDADLPDAADADADAEPLPDPFVYAAEADPAASTDCLDAPPSAGETRAKVISCEGELLTGAVAMGRVGDILLENAHGKFILRASDGSATTIGAFAGGVIDAAPHGAPDLIKEIVVGLDISGARPTELVITEAGDDGAATVRVLYELDQLALISSVIPGGLRPARVRGAIDYELRPDEAALRVTVHLTPLDGTAMATGRPTLIALMGGAPEVLQPETGVLDDDNLGGSTGPTMVAEAPGSALAVRVVADVGGVTHIDSINIIQASERVLTRAGEDALFEAFISVGENAAEAQRGAYLDDARSGVVVSGTPGDRVVVLDSAGGELLRSWLDDAGEATVSLPDGDYSVRPGFGPFFPGDAVAFTLAGDGAAAVAQAPSGTLHVEATADGDASAPVRVTVIDDGGAELPRLVAMGPSDFRLPPGNYQVTVSRGLEFDIAQQDVTLADGATVEVVASIDRVVDTTGWVGGDFHLHSEMSTDSTHAVADAVRIVAAEGLEVVAATDHDFINDYDPAIVAAGLDGYVMAIVGEEVSHTILGHINGYPLTRQPGVTGAGAIEWFDMAPPAIFDALRDIGDTSVGGAIVQLNHPHRNGAGWFRAIELDPVTGMAGVTPEDLGLPAETDLNGHGFDVIEAWNKSPGDTDEVTLIDLLGFWKLGRRFGMMGNSDSHDPGNPAGSPRTFVAVADDSPGAYDWAEVGASIRDAQMTVSGGIFVTAAVDGVIAGDSVPLAVRVQAAPWIEATRLRVYAGTDIVVDMALDGAGDPVVRFDAVVDVPLMGEDFVAVRVDGGRDPEPVIDFTPFGITNPILVR